MAKLTIAQRRERQLNNFNEEFINDMETAKKIVNSFYRLCGLCERVCYLENDERTCNGSYCKQEEEKEAKHIKRLNEYLKPYGLKLAFCGIYPTIAIVNEERNTIERDVFYLISY